MTVNSIHDAARQVIRLLVRFNDSLRRHPVLWFLGLCLLTLAGLLLSEPFQQQLPPEGTDRLMVYAVADVMLTLFYYVLLRLVLPAYLWFAEKAQPRLFEED